MDMWSSRYGSSQSTVRVGTAGWTIPRDVAGCFQGEGHGLERYAAVFNAVEINSTFYKPHRRSTFARWTELTPDHFRFSIKAPRTITHESRLEGAGPALRAFVNELEPLGAKLGVLLVQLPPSLVFDARLAQEVFAEVRTCVSLLPIACEPRHPTWFTAEAEDLFVRFQISRVAADPAKPEGAGAPGGWAQLHYHRLHGSPRMYYSAYGPDYVSALAKQLEGAPARDAWCIFDNTALGAATSDALELQRRVRVNGAG